MSKILITGAGMVGAQIARILHQDHGVRVILLDRYFHDDYLDTILPRRSYDRAQGDLLDSEFIEATLRKHSVDRVIHSAAVLPMRVGHDAHPGFYRVNCWGTSQLMFKAREAGVSKFIMFSTNGVYQFRSHKVDAPVGEDFPSGLSHHNSYGNSKAVAEYLLRELVQDGAFAANIVRPGEIFGPVMNRGDDSPIYWKAILDAAIKGVPLKLTGHPEHRLDWVYSKDVARLAVTLVLADETPHIEYHASSGTLMGIYDLKAELDRQFPDNQIELNDCAHGGWDFPLSIDRARQDLGFKSVFDLEGGIQDYVCWYKSCQTS